MQPSLSISKLKLKLDDFIAAGIKSDVRVSFGEIFQFLVDEGFMPCNLYALLTGFLLKEYAREPYRYSIGVDGDEGGSLKADKLASLIEATIKQFQRRQNNYRERYLEVMSRSQREFMNFAHEVFGIDTELSVESGAQRLRNKIITLGYPVWCYVDAAAAPYKKFAKDFSDVANSAGRDSVAALAERMGNFLSESPTHLDALKKLFTQEIGRQSLEKFLRELDDGIIFELGAEDVTGEVQRRISAGDALWLWDKEVAAGEIRKLIVEYKIVAATNALGISCTSFRSCISEWKYKTHFMRVPCKIFSDYYPALKKFFELLYTVAKRGELPNDKHEKFLVELENNAALIREALQSACKVLREKYSATLSGLSEKDVEDMVLKLPTSSFVDDKNNFLRNLEAKVNELKKKRLNFKLKERWQELTGSESPRAWSKKNLTPILALVPESERDAARKFFDVIMSAHADENEIKSALNYLETPPAYFQTLNDKIARDAAVRREVIGDSQILFEDVDEVRRKIESKISEEPYLWHMSTAVKNVVKELAEFEYAGGASKRVEEKIAKMDAAHAKDYLIRLVKDNYKIGIEILSEEA